MSHWTGHGALYWTRVLADVSRELRWEKLSRHSRGLRRRALPELAHPSLKPITRYPAAVQGPMPPLNSGPLTLPNPRTHSTRRPIPGDARHPRHPAGTKAGKARARTRGLSDVGKVAYHKARGALWLVVSVQNRYSYGTIEVHGVKRGERICTGSFGRFSRFFGGCRVGFGFRLYSARFGFESGLGFFFRAWFFFRGFVPWFALVGFRPRMLWRLSPLSVSSPPSHASSFACASLALARLGGGVSRGRVWVMRVRMYRPPCVFGRYYPWQTLVKLVPPRLPRSWGPLT